MLNSDPINYALNFWDELEIYCDHGYVDIDNNSAERAMRPVALGRKNWLFAGSDGGGKTAATMLSLIETAKQLGVNAITYILDLLTIEKYDKWSVANFRTVTLMKKAIPEYRHTQEYEPCIHLKLAINSLN